MIKNDVTLGLFICYSIYLPLLVGFYGKLRKQDLSSLLTFDMIFILDRFSQLFVVHVNKDGVPEPNLCKVLMRNLSFSIFLEIFITIFPILVIGEEGLFDDSLSYFFIKFPRIIRMFESS